MDNVLQINQIQVNNRKAEAVPESEGNKSHSKFSKFLNPGDEIFTKEQACLTDETRNGHQENHQIYVDYSPEIVTNFECDDESL